MAVILDESGIALLDEMLADIYDEAGPGTTPVTGTGVTQRLNAVRESERGLDITLWMSQALGATLQFLNTGTERLYVFPESAIVTAAVGIESLVLGESVTQFPAVTLTAGSLYVFGPFHTALQVPGTSTIQVTLSTTYGVQVLVVQGPYSH